MTSAAYTPQVHSEEFCNSIAHCNEFIKMSFCKGAALACMRGIRMRTPRLKALGANGAGVAGGEGVPEVIIAQRRGLS